MPIHDRYCPKFYSKTVQRCTCKPTYTKSELDQQIEQACREQREASAKKFKANAEVFGIHPKIIADLILMIKSATNTSERK